MAYADTSNTQRKMGTAIAVTAIEVGLAWAMIAGLAVSYTPRSEPRFTTTFTDKPEIPKPAEAIPPPPPSDDRRVIDPPLPQDPPIGLGTGTITAGLGESTGLGAGDAVGSAVFPTPTPDPPAFPAIKAKPRGKPALWVTPDDYPSMELRLGREGISSFRLAIDAAGKPTDCTIVVSSGWPGLDQATCAKIMRRARFEPATDSTGARVEGAYAGAVNWQIPKD